MKWYKHLFIYLGCIVATEVFIALLFLLGQLYTGRNVWYAFAWVQIVVPFFALCPFLLIEDGIAAENDMKARIQRLKQILEEYKRENKDE